MKMGHCGEARLGQELAGHPLRRKWESDGELGRVLDEARPPTPDWAEEKQAEQDYRGNQGLGLGISGWTR